MSLRDYFIPEPCGPSQKESFLFFCVLRKRKKKEKRKKNSLEQKVYFGMLILKHWFRLVLDYKSNSNIEEVHLYIFVKEVHPFFFGCTVYIKISNVNA